MKPARFQLSLFDAPTPQASVVVVEAAPAPALAPSASRETPRVLPLQRLPAPLQRVPASLSAGANVDVEQPSGSASPRPLSRTKALVDAIHAHQPGARVVITDNRTVLLSQSTKDGLRTVRVHQMFLDAPHEVRVAVGHYLARGDRKSGSVVDAFVDAQGHLLELAARPLPKDAHVGNVHNLAPLFGALNATYFDNAIDAELMWGQAGSPCRRRRRSITFGSWDSRAKRIVIHPVLDQREVPVVAIARVLHHEMVHAKVGEERGPSGTRIVHGRTFKTEEARFREAKEADAWFDKNLDALLRWRPGQVLGRRA